MVNGVIVRGQLKLRRTADDVDEEEAAETEAEEDDDFDPEDSDADVPGGAPSARRRRPTRAARPKQCLVDSDDDNEEAEDDETAPVRRGRAVLDDSDADAAVGDVDETPKPASVSIISIDWLLLHACMQSHVGFMPARARSRFRHSTVVHTGS